MRSSLLILCQQNGLSFTDLAYDCIAEAFVKDSQNEFPILKNFTSSLHARIDILPEHEIFIAYKCFITTIADTQLARLYAQSDPAGAKIHRNIRECAKKSMFFSLSKDSRGSLLKPTGCDVLEHLPQFPREQLEADLLSAVDHQRTSDKLLEVLYSILVHQEMYRRSVPLNDVVQACKKLFQAGYQPEEQSDFHSEIESLTDFEIETLCTQVEYVLKEKIVLTYLARGKINRKEAEAIFSAFQDMIDDWVEGTGENYSLYEYFSRRLPIDERTYEAQFRPKIEYLLKIVRQEFAARLLREI